MIEFNIISYTFYKKKRNYGVALLQKMDYFCKGGGVKIKKAQEYEYVWNKNEIQETKTIANVIIVRK